MTQSPPECRSSKPIELPCKKRGRDPNQSSGKPVSGMIQRSENRLFLKPWNAAKYLRNMVQSCYRTSRHQTHEFPRLQNERPNGWPNPASPGRIDMTLAKSAACPLSGKIIGIDPGTSESAWVMVQATTPLAHAKERNSELLDSLRGGFNPADLVAIEMIASYGMPVGREVFETCLLIGRMVEAWEARGGTVRLVYRREVKLFHRSEEG